MNQAIHMHEGYLEYISEERIAGWAARIGDLNPVEVQILVNDKVLGQVSANIMRQDLRDSGKGNGVHAFNFYFPKPIKDFFRPERIQVRIRGTGHVLAKTAELIDVLEAVDSAVPETAAQSTSAKGAAESAAGDIAFGILSAATTATPTPGQGAFLGIQNRKLFGWAVLEAERTEIFVTVDGKVLGEANAAGSQTLKDVGPTMALHGFEIPVPKTLATGVERKIAIYDAANGTRIRSNPEKLLFPKTDDRPATATATAPARALDPLAEIARARQAPIPQARDTASNIKPAPAPAIAPHRANRLAVVAWDMAHNPVGRAFLLADLATENQAVELIGPTFAFYGGRIWPPIANTTIAMQSFPATDMQSLVAGAVELASKVKCDAVIVGKPRLSSLLIGALIRHFNDCPMIVDIDDHELSFVQNRTPASFEELVKGIEADPAKSNVPYNDLWTRFCETLVSEADSIIVSNVALRHKFGGMIVRHARDERSFNPSLYDRTKTRTEFGYTDTDRVVLFLGTPRAHKGIFQLADALEKLNDPRLALCVIGTVTDKRILARFAAYKKARIKLHPDQPWERLPELVNMADQVAILQDPSHPIAEFQIPAKLTDSLALDVPVLATVVPPLRDLAFADVFEPIDSPADVEPALARLAESAPRGTAIGRGREAFLTEFSYGVNRARLDLALAQAKQSRKPDLPKFESLFRLLEQQTDIQLPRLTNAPPRLDRRAPMLATDKPRDLIFLWKQNDSDIYGRRSDMIAKYLLKTGRVRRVIHLDAPLSAADLERQAAQSDGDSAHQGNLVYVNTVRRILKTADTPSFLRRTYLYRSGARPERALGRDLPTRDGYPDFIRKVMKELDTREAPLLWVCPVVFDYQAVADIVRPVAIVADIIDDQRTFPGDSESHRQRVAGSYATILQEADAVFCNCNPVRDAFADLRPDISVVPNGAELLPDFPGAGKPPELANFPRPIIGYVGNLRDRVDYDLVEAVARKYPDGTVVLIGSAHGQPEVPKLAARCPNIKLLGVRPYEEAQRIMRGFDVAMMPHLKTEQSDRMNPLKLYVYFSVGVPIVTTEVANIGDLAPYVNVAQDSASFLAAIADVLAGTGKQVTEEARQTILGALSWESRVAEIWQHLVKAI